MELFESILNFWHLFFEKIRQIVNFLNIGLLFTQSWIDVFQKIDEFFVEWISCILRKLRNSFSLIFRFHHFILWFLSDFFDIKPLAGEFGGTFFAIKEIFLIDDNMELSQFVFMIFTSEGIVFVWLLVLSDWLVFAGDIVALLGIGIVPACKASFWFFGADHRFPWVSSVWWDIVREYVFFVLDELRVLVFRVVEGSLGSGSSWSWLLIVFNQKVIEIVGSPLVLVEDHRSVNLLIL